MGGVEPELYYLLAGILIAGFVAIAIHAFKAKKDD